MRKLKFLLVFVVLSLHVMMTGCGPGAEITPSSTTSITETPVSTTAPPTPEPPPTPTPAPPPPGETIVVSSAADSGPGTFRQALLDAQPGDTITFDPVSFPPEAPARILLNSCLSPIDQGYLTVDASDAGVILDGSNITDEWCSGLTVTSSWNTIRGLWFQGYIPGAGISLSSGAQHNLIGGDPTVGAGPAGQGNRVTQGDVGITLGGAGTSFNTITGNPIGVEPDGAEPLLNEGLGIEDGASYNVIGPGNIFAYGYSAGIEVVDADSIGNTITQNSIYANTEMSIGLGRPDRAGGNTELAAPVIIDFDLAAGRASGSACPSCTVELFSDEGNQGRIYEGQTVADASGGFVFERGTSLAGPHLTATATDSDGSTSSFSDPTTGLRQSVVFQIGNDLLREQFLHRPSTALEDNHLGEMNPIFCDESGEDVSPSWFWRADALGLKWMRGSFDWFDWPEVEQTGDYSEHQIDPCQIQAIDWLYDNDIKIMYTLLYWDPAIETHPGYSRFQTEDEIEAFLDYVRFIVSSLAGKIEWYALWNEPNLPGDDQQHILVEDYINLVRHVVPVIRELDPHAKIVIPDVCPLNECGSYDYLMTILQTDDIMSAVDGIAWHGSSGNSLEYQPDFYNSYPTWVENIVETAEAHGFRGQYFSQELHWRTPDTPQPIHGMPWFYSDTVSAKYYARGIVWHLGQGFIVGIGHEGYEQIPEVRRVVQNLATLMAGATPADLPVVIDSSAAPVRVSSFVLPDGSYLVALWRDEVAVDDDPGIPAAVTIPGLAGYEVAGIDVLYGFEQPLVTEDEGSDLVVHDLLLKDYPIILRLTP